MRALDDSPPADRRPAWGRLALPGLCALIGLLYLVGTSENYTYADDSLTFAHIVLHGAQVNVHHIALSLLHRAAATLGIHDLDAAILLFKLYVALTSTLCLYLIGALALDWYGSRAAAIATVLACALGFGYWTYSITTDLYVPASAFALLAIWLAGRSESSRRPSLLLALASVSVVLSAIHHQAYCLIAVALLMTLLLAGRGQRSRRERWRRSLTFAVPTLALGLAIFSVAFLASDESDFLHFLRGYEAWMTMLPYDTVNARTPLYALIGIARALVFPDYVLRFDSMYEFVQQQFALKIVMDDRYLLADMSLPTVIAMLAFSALACCALLFLAAVAARRGWRPRRRAPGFYALLGWVGLQTGFFALWEPSSNEFWIWLMPCLALLVVAPAASQLRRGPAWAVPWLLVLSLAAANGLVVRRYGSPERCIYRINKTYLVQLGHEDLVISGDNYVSMRLESLYPSPSAKTNFYLGSFTLRDSSVAAQVDTVAARGGRVFLDPMLVMPNEAELKLQTFFVRSKQQIDVDVEESEQELLRFEALCRSRRIPLYGITRKGGDIVSFRKRRFNGWLRYISPDSVGDAPRGT